MSNIWQTLGLDGPTSDLKTIKKAYANRLKVVRPDDDPAGFMKLRQAFDQARKSASSPPKVQLRTEPEDLTPHPETAGKAARTDDHEVDADPAPLISPDLDPKDALNIESDIWPEAPIPTGNDLPAYRAADALMDRVQALYETGAQNETEAWRQILDEGLGLSIDDFEQFENSLKFDLITRFKEAEIEERGQFNFRDLRELKTPPIERTVFSYLLKQMGWSRSLKPLTRDGIDDFTRLQFKTGILAIRYENKMRTVVRNRHVPKGAKPPLWVVMAILLMAAFYIPFVLYPEIQKDMEAGGQETTMADVITDLNKSGELSLSESRLRAMSYERFKTYDLDNILTVLQQDGSREELANRAMLESYLMEPNTDVTSLVIAMDGDGLSADDRATLQQAFARMKERWELNLSLHNSALKERVQPMKPLSPQMQYLLGMGELESSQSVEDTLKMLESLTIDPSDHSKTD